MSKYIDVDSRLVNCTALSELTDFGIFVRTTEDCITIELSDCNLSVSHVVPWLELELGRYDKDEMIERIVSEMEQKILEQSK